ncbi:hypothetical protein GALL_110070 [mine drainage metagenome]|uniref:Type II secretion system protein GspC N-terminal domain-containing protein n=1 Tax=mine drainage metagenome TaxID=410659 RepID=A0A1J5SED6_9ZZZZ
MLNSSRGWLILLALLVLAGYVEWLLAPTPPAPRALRRAAEPWVLPPIRKAQPEQAMALLNKTSLWGKLPAVEAAKSANDPEWHFLGIATNGSERYVLIKMEGQPEQRLTINDKLPGGSKILKIENDTLCILIDGKKRRLGIYETGPKFL